jgi:uncharacterized protein YkwD
MAFKTLRAVLVGAVLAAASVAGGVAQDDGIAAAVQHNLATINDYRAKAGAPPMTLDDSLNTFAQAGSDALKTTHEPHGHFNHSDLWHSGFQGGAAENQGDPNGWPMHGNLNDTVDAVLKFMMDEGPGGGHHDNILNPKYRKLGVGVVRDGDKLYLTNDFSN